MVFAVSSFVVTDCGVAVGAEFATFARNLLFELTVVA
jgi:hypothetical protein